MGHFPQIGPLDMEAKQDSQNYRVMDRRTNIFDVPAPKSWVYKIWREYKMAMFE